MQAFASDYLVASDQELKHYAVAGKMALESAIIQQYYGISNSPGGTTIAGIGAMEKVDFAVLQDGVVTSCSSRIREIILAILVELIRYFEASGGGEEARMLDFF